MATVNYRNGRAEIRFYDHRGDRRSVALGKVTKRAAESAMTHIQGLLNSKIGGLQPDAENVRWVSNQRPRIVDYLAGLELIQPRKVEVVAVAPEVKQAPKLTTGTVSTLLIDRAAKELRRSGIVPRIRH